MIDNQVITMTLPATNSLPAFLSGVDILGALTDAKTY